MKLQKIYICEKCQFECTKWTGKCPQCNAWNSFHEDVVEKGKSKISSTPRVLKSNKAEPLKSHHGEFNRLSTNIGEFDRVLGGGIAPGSLTLLTGEPGIGKSTITLQLANNIAKSSKVLLVSGEESLEQIGQRAARLKLSEDKLTAIHEHNLETILESIKDEEPKFVIIDSIQVISSMELPSHAGSVTQVRYCAEQILEVAKSKNIATMIIGHVTKDGNLAGPRVLEHLVDTVLHLEGDRFHQFRMLRAAKNRFGSCNEVGIFEMNQSGLEEVKNPSEQFLAGRKKDAIGSAITITMEGTRPLLIEVQALVSTSPFGYPKRTANGFDLNRLQILIAVLQKHGKLNLQNQDVFVNVVGGIKLTEPAADLAVLMAIASSFLKKTIPTNAVILGEVGLSGELRRVSHAEKRQKEAEKLNFKQVISSGELKEIHQALSILEQDSKS